MARGMAKRDEWQRRIERQRRSGQSVFRFCQEEGVSPSAFYFWKRALRQARAIQAAGRGPAAPPVIEPAPSAGRFLPVTVLPDRPVAAPRGEAALAIEFPHGVRVEVGTGCDRALLRDVLEWCHTAGENRSC